MDGGLLTFKKFRDAEIAADIAQKLHGSDIYFVLENDAKFFDPTFAHNPLQNETRIKIKPPDFAKARLVLENYYDAQLDHIPADHYLFDFSDTELFEILAKPDEWGELDFRLAKKILQEREYDIQEDDILSLKEKRVTELAKPESSQRSLIIAGYFAAFMGGIFGLVTGWILTHAKRTLPDGTTAYTYVEADRRHGRVISVIGIIVFAATLAELFFGIHPVNPK